MKLCWHPKRNWCFLLVPDYVHAHMVLYSSFPSHFLKMTVRKSRFNLRKGVPYLTNLISRWFLIIISKLLQKIKYELPHDKANKMACAPSEESDQPGHPPSLIRTFAVRMKKAWVLGYPLSGQWRLWSDWRRMFRLIWVCTWRSHFVSFVMRRLNYI